MPTDTATQDLIEMLKVSATDERRRGNIIMASRLEQAAARLRDMNKTWQCVPTPEVWTAKINGAEIPLRIWRALSPGGIEVEMHVVSITPNNADDHAKLKAELPADMRPSREVFHIETTKPNGD